MTTAPAHAFAACPGVFAVEPPDAYGAAYICTAGALFVTCDLGANGDSSDTTAWFVMSSATHFKAYGTAGNGNKFCYEVDLTDTCGAGNQNTFTIRGTESDDEIHNVDLVDGNDLGCGYVYVYGEYGADSIYGSPDTTAIESLQGDAGSDAIRGSDGNDTLSGGDGFDLLWGGPGDDVISGGIGDDKIKGGTGVDTMAGNDGDDDVCGEGGDDALLDGGSGIDLLDGGSGDDDVSIVGGADSDSCENDSAVCEDLTLPTCAW